jgi:hypothetical protein
MGRKVAIYNLYECDLHRWRSGRVGSIRCAKTSEVIPVMQRSVHPMNSNTNPTLRCARKSGTRPRGRFSLRSNCKRRTRHAGTGGRWPSSVGSRNGGKKKSHRRTRCGWVAITAVSSVPSRSRTVTSSLPHCSIFGDFEPALTPRGDPATVSTAARRLGRFCLSPIQNNSDLSQGPARHSAAGSCSQPIACRRKGP